MPILFFDFESHYDDTYSLRHLTPPEYILDNRWETIGCAFRVEGEGASTFVDGPEIPEYLAQFDPAKTTTVAFNALFDSCVLAYRYGFVPARMVCTMRMAVALRGHLLPSHSLAKVGEFLGVGVKGNAILQAKGKHRADLMADPAVWAAYKAYANNDNDMNRSIFYKLAPEFPSSERRIMDRVLRCAVEPKFVVDTVMLTEHLADLKEAKAELLIEAGAPTTMDAPDRADRLEEFAKTLRSNDKFEEILKLRGVDIEYKTSLSDPDRQIPAFAKTDNFMAALQEHEDPEIQALAGARLGLRSTIEESRGTRLLSIASLPWPVTCSGTMPFPLKYSGAHTHRFGGDWLINLQNLPAGRGTNKSKLRKALKAPDGHKVVVADKSQIECRINGWLCGQSDLLDIFARGGDPYSVLASAIFGFVVDKNIHKTERFIGKAGVLGLGFGCGDDKFYNMVVRQARNLGMDVRELLKIWSPQLAQKSVRTYRTLNTRIVNAWHRLDAIIQTAWLGHTQPVMFGPVEIGKGYVMGPGGLTMRYGNPGYDHETGEYYYTYGRTRRKIYGSALLENIVQFLARINTMHDALRISDRGFRFVGQSHDELIWIVPDDQAQRCLDVALEEMRRPPSWAPVLPLNAEGGFGQAYGDVK